MGNVAFAELAIGIQFAEAGLNDTAFLILEALGAGLRIGRSGTGGELGLRGGGEAGGGGHGGGRTGGDGGVRAVAHIAVVGAVRLTRHDGGCAGRVRRKGVGSSM